MRITRAICHCSSKVSATVHSTKQTTSTFLESGKAREKKVHQPNSNRATSIRVEVSQSDATSPNNTKAQPLQAKQF